MELQTILPGALAALLIVREWQHERKERELLNRILSQQGHRPITSPVAELLNRGQEKAASTPPLRRFARFTVDGPPRVTNVVKPWRRKEVKSG